MSAPRFRLRIDFDDNASLGPGKIALLEAIAASGSLSEAARRMKMSYRRAWLLVEEINQAFAERATQSAVGGAGGGGMDVTAFGRGLISRFRAFERSVTALGTQRFATIAAAVSERKPASRARSARPLNRISARQR